MIIGKLIPAGTGMTRYRNVIAVRIKPEAIPEYWLARQREIQEAAESGERVSPGSPPEEPHPLRRFCSPPPGVRGERG